MDEDKKPRKRRCHKWDKSIPDRLIEYFDQEPYEILTEKRYHKNGTLAEEKEVRVAKPIPTIRKFARSIDVNYRTIYTWMDPKSTRYKKSLAKAFTIARDLRMDIIVDGGLLGIYNSNFAKFAAVNMTDMVSEKKMLDTMIDTKPDKEIKYVMFSNPDA